MSESKWSTVVLPHARMPRFRRMCSSCGARPCASERALRVPWVGARAADATVTVPASVDVPICGRCRLRRSAWRAAWVVAFVGVVMIVPVRDQRPALWVGIPLLLAFAALCAASVSWSPAGIDVAANEAGLRWSFRKREVAEAFATDNGAAIETKLPPERVIDDHDPDGVDHTGLHADTPDDG